MCGPGQDSDTVFWLSKPFGSDIAGLTIFPRCSKATLAFIDAKVVKLTVIHRLPLAWATTYMT